MSPIATETLRALEVFDRLPAGCFLIMQDDRAHEPHIHVGEWAVVDPADVDVVSGELYLIAWKSSRRLSICQVILRDNAGCAVADFAPLNRPRSKADLEERLRTGRDLFCGDSGLNAVYLPQYIKGRVIGIYQAPERVPATGLLSFRD